MKFKDTSGASCDIVRSPWGARWGKWAEVEVDVEADALVLLVLAES